MDGNPRFPPGRSSRSSSRSQVSRSHDCNGAMSVLTLTDRYAPLPALEHKLPFLTTIQLPMLMAYHSRVTGSLDAFETLSSAFVRAVPGALSGNTRGGVHVDPAKVTGGTAGLTKLVKAGLSAGWVLEALRAWSDDPVSRCGACWVSAYACSSSWN
jgi:hypothetical protein